MAAGQSCPGVSERGDWSGRAQQLFAGQDRVCSGCPGGRWERPLPQHLGCSRSLALEGGKHAAIGAMGSHCTKFCPGPCPGGGGAQLASPL